MILNILSTFYFFLQSWLKSWLFLSIWTLSKKNSRYRKAHYQFHRLLRNFCHSQIRIIFTLNKNLIKSQANIVSRHMTALQKSKVTFMISAPSSFLQLFSSFFYTCLSCQKKVESRLHVIPNDHIDSRSLFSKRNLEILSNNERRWKERNLVAILRIFLLFCSLSEERNYVVLYMCV